MDPVMSEHEIAAFLTREFAQVAGLFTVEGVTGHGLRLRRAVTARDLRPGGTISGPAMFELADVAIYLAILSRIGPVALAVTVNASIDFLRKPPADGGLVADVRLLKLGRQLAVAEALVLSDGQDGPVARASMTYAIPPRGRG
jgi:uncharacterized protein (TIGR00369 family)